MKSSGFIRRVDASGELVLTNAIRRTLGIGDADALEIYSHGEDIVLKRISKPKAAREQGKKVLYISFFLEQGGKNNQRGGL